MTRILISVSDKTGLDELAGSLAAADGVELVSTGGSARALEAAGASVTRVEHVTGFPEILDGRVKTLHPAIHAGLLARRDLPAHVQTLAEHDIEPFDAVVVNLYPFGETVADPAVTLEQAVEQIDVGGPTMIRAAAKNHDALIVIVDPADYPRLVAHVTGAQPLDAAARLELAGKAFRHTAAYDATIADYLTRASGDEYPEQLTITLEKVQDLRYGENPHQSAAFYTTSGVGDPGVADAEQLQGRELSYNNISDTSAALDLLAEFDRPAAVVVKHTNPCGVAVGSTIDDAWDRALAADPVSVFGGIVALNRVVDEQLAQHLSQIFLEVVAAPGFTDEALAVLVAKENLRLLRTTGAPPAGDAAGLRSFRRAVGVSGGGLLMQQYDHRRIARDDLRTVTRVAATDAQIDDLLFAWNVVKHVKSNAVVLASRGQTLGVGAGQMNRVGAARIAIAQAGERSAGSVLASDAFFPMADSVEEAAAAGIGAIIQPGGSRRDAECIEAADAAGIAMVFTGVRHFRH